MISEVWFGLCGCAIVGTWVWARCGGFDPCWRILLHVLSIATYFVLWIADIVMQMN
jgi:hypothetical protein